MSNLIILKLGGSSITKKAENKFEMNYEVLKRSALEIKEALKEDPSLEIAVVCGVGPFGHTNVKKYDINDGVTTAHHKEGVKKTNADCDYLGKEVIKVFKKNGLKSELILGYKVCVQKNKIVESFNLEPYKKALSEKIIPITTGVMVPDTKLTWSVMSGDQVIGQLAKHLNPKKVLMGTDVQGIFTADPRVDKNAELIKEINKNNIEGIREKVGESKSVDVTGGMKGKLQKLENNLSGVTIEIFSLFTKGNLRNALLGKEVTGTKIIL